MAKVESVTGFEGKDFQSVAKGQVDLDGETEKDAETEAKETLDAFAEAVQAILAEARADPELLRRAPTRTRVTRFDEVTAARQPRLTG